MYSHQKSCKKSINLAAEISQDQKDHETWCDECKEYGELYDTANDCKEEEDDEDAWCDECEEYGQWYDTVNECKGDYDNLATLETTPKYKSIMSTKNNKKICNDGWESIFSLKDCEEAVGLKWTVVEESNPNPNWPKCYRQPDTETVFFNSLGKAGCEPNADNNFSNFQCFCKRSSVTSKSGTKKVTPIDDSATLQMAPQKVKTKSQTPKIRDACIKNVNPVDCEYNKCAGSCESLKDVHCYKICNNQYTRNSIFYNTACRKDCVETLPSTDYKCYKDCDIKYPNSTVKYGIP